MQYDRDNLGKPSKKQSVFFFTPLRTPLPLKCGKNGQNCAKSAKKHREHVLPNTVFLY